MKTKTVEVRDRLTFLVIIAIKPSPRNEEERYLWSRVGYGQSAEDQSRYVLVAKLGDDKFSYDPNTWSNRTMYTAHKYLQENWDSVQNGQVLDVEYILGETDSPKISERIGSFNV